MALKNLLFIPLVLTCLVLGNLHYLHGKGTIWDDIGTALERSNHPHDYFKRDIIKRDQISHNIGASIARRVSAIAVQRLVTTQDKQQDNKSNTTTYGPPVSNRTSSIRIPLIPTPNTTIPTAGTNSTHRIPRRLFFTYSRNLIYDANPKHLHDNVHRTIRFFTEGWGLADQSQLDVRFLTNADCIRLLEEVEPRLIPVFHYEPLGSYMADMCRLAALHIHGGYYLDVDIEPVQMMEPPPEVDFITSKMTNGMYFQAVMAASAGHPILKSALESMIIDWYMIPSVLKEFSKTDTFDANFFRSKHYNDRRLKHIGGLGLNHDPILMGPMTLRVAFDHNQNATTPWFLLEEDNSKLKLYPKWIRKATFEQSWGCNYMVHDPVNKTAYFYSRCRGTRLCPFEKN